MLHVMIILYVVCCMLCSYVDVQQFSLPLFAFVVLFLMYVLVIFWFLTFLGHFRMAVVAIVVVSRLFCDISYIWYTDDIVY